MTTANDDRGSPGRLFKLREVAEIAGLSLRSVRLAVRDGRLKAVRLSPRVVVVTSVELKRFTDTAGAI